MGSNILQKKTRAKFEKFVVLHAYNMKPMVYFFYISFTTVT